MTYQERKKALALLLSYLESLPCVPQEIRKVMDTLKVKDYAKKGVQTYRVGYNCTLTRYFAKVKEMLQINKELTWPEVQRTFLASMPVFVRRYNLFQKKFPNEAADVRLIVTTEGISLYKEMENIR